MIGQLVKKSTGITGLRVEPNARSILSELYHKTLTKLGAIPAGTPYRTTIENLTKHRLQIVQSNSNIIDIEEKIYSGQVEELIVQAKDELSVIDLFVKDKLWINNRPERPTIPFISNK
eukprot:gene4900-6109_t